MMLLLGILVSPIGQWDPSACDISVAGLSAGHATAPFPLDGDFLYCGFSEDPYKSFYTNYCAAATQGNPDYLMSLTYGTVTFPQQPRGWYVTGFNASASPARPATVFARCTVEHWGARRVLW